MALIIKSTSKSDKPIDHYPSRGVLQPQLIDRLDPVTYISDKEPLPISPALLKQYQKNGFMVLEGIFTQDEVIVFQQELGHLRSSSTIQNSGEIISELGSNDIRSIFRVHQVSEVFKKVATDRRLAGLAQCLLGDQVYIHQSRLNYKPGFRGKEFYWHSDFETWHVEDGMPRMRALSMSVSLTNNDDTNGPLMLIPGSHQKYVVCEGDTPDNHFEASLKKQEYGVPSDECLSRLVNDGGIVTSRGKPGSVTIFDCNTMHGSNGNITPYARSNAFFVFNAISNRVGAPFCNQPPRPEYLCSRKTITPIKV